jgi:hypothetical protein
LSSCRATVYLPYRALTGSSQLGPCKSFDGSHRRR